MIKKLLLVLLFLALTPLLVAIALIAMVFVAAIALYAWVSLRWVSWRRGQWNYLVYSPKGGWNDFVQNNLLPALPHSIAAVAVETRPPTPRARYLDLLVYRGTGVAKPYLAKVTLLGMRIQSLNDHLWKMKKLAARNADLQQVLARYLSERVSSR